MHQFSCTLQYLEDDTLAPSRTSACDESDLECECGVSCDEGDEILKRPPPGLERDDAETVGDSSSAQQAHGNSFKSKLLSRSTLTGEHTNHEKNTKLGKWKLNPHNY